MITQQKVTFIFQKLHHFYGDKSRATSQPAATSSIKMNMISAGLLSTAQFKSCYTCELNSISVLIFFHVIALHFQPETLYAIYYLVGGLWCFQQQKMKVSWDFSFSVSYTNYMPLIHWSTLLNLHVFCYHKEGVLTIAHARHRNRERDGQFLVFTVVLRYCKLKQTIRGRTRQAGVWAVRDQMQKSENRLKYFGRKKKGGQSSRAEKVKKEISL